jgi:hypothetical protein
MIIQNPNAIQKYILFYYFFFNPEIKKERVISSPFSSLSTYDAAVPASANYSVSSTTIHGGRKQSNSVHASDHKRRE